VPLYRHEAVVLRTHQLGEADRVITLLPRQHGRIRAVAKGVRSHPVAVWRPPRAVHDGRVRCYEGANLDTVTQAETITPPAQTICRIRVNGNGPTATGRIPANVATRADSLMLAEPCIAGGHA